MGQSTLLNDDDFLRSIGKVEPKAPIGVATPTVQEGVSVQDLTEGDSFKIISSYMDDRFGMREDNYSKQEIVDSYINNMRQFSFGQSVTALQELSYLNRGEGGELDARRLRAGNAYKLFDSMQNVFTDENTGVAEKADAVYDYARALIVDPVNLLSLGVGKLAATGATKAATSVLKSAAVRAAEKAATEAATKGVISRSVVEASKRGAERLAYTKAMEGAAYKTALNKAAKKEIIASGLFDTAAAVGVDVAQQAAEIKAGVMQEYDPLRGSFATLGGLSGFGLAYGLNSLRGVSAPAMLSLELERSLEVEAAAEKLARKEARQAGKELAKVELGSVLDNDSILKNTSILTKQVEPFIDKVQRGLKSIYSDPDDFGKAADATVARLFFLGDKEAGINGLVNVLDEAGLPKWSPRSDKDTFTNYLGDAIRSLKPSVRAEVDKTFKDIFGKFDSPYSKLSIEDFLDVDAAEISEAGRKMQAKAQLNSVLKIVNKSVDEVSDEEVVGSILDIGKETIHEKVASFGKTMQQNYIRMLVTHPATTALNVMGWAYASSVQSLSDMIRAPLYGGTAIVSSLVGKDLTAAKYSNLARQSVNLQKQKLLNILDPYSTYESAMDYLTYRPEAQKALFKYLSGGVESGNILKELSVPAGDKLHMTRHEALLDKIQTAYGVKAQDFLSKTQEFMYAIDKRIRQEYGVSYQEFLKRDDLSKHLISKDTAQYQKFLKIETEAVNDALRNTLSKSYGSDKGLLPRVAKVIEEARNIPGIGAMVPFGQFFNNTVGFMFDHTGLSLAHKFATGSERDAFDLATKAAVGWGLIGVAGARELKNLEDGLAWYEERDGTGAIRNRAYDYPLSFFKMAGRIAAHAYRDGEVPTDILNEFKNNFGTGQMSRQLGDVADSVFRMVGALASGDLEESKDLFFNTMADSTAMYVSGYTRFADPVNQIVALGRGEDYVAVDRKQGHETLNKSLRYIDQFFELATGEALAPEKKYSTTGESAGAPIGRLFGYRENLPHSTVQQLFNDVGRPDWSDGIKADTPEAVNTFRGIVFPILEMYANTAVDSEKWKSLSLSDRQGQLKEILRLAKNDAKEFLKESYDPTDKKVGVIMQISDRGISKKDMNNVLDLFGLERDSLWKLDLPQLELLDYYLSNANERKKLLSEEIGVR